MLRDISFCKASLCWGKEDSEWLPYSKLDKHTPSKSTSIY